MAGVRAGLNEAGDIGTIPTPDRERALVMTSDAVPSPAVGFLAAANSAGRLDLREIE